MLSKFLDQIEDRLGSNPRRSASQLKTLQSRFLRHDLAIVLFRSQQVRRTSYRVRAVDALPHSVALQDDKEWGLEMWNLAIQ